MAKENTKAIDYIFSEYRIAKMKGNSAIVTPEKLESFGIDISKDKISIKNLVLKQESFFNKKYTVYIIDKKRNWEGILITDCEDLEEKVLKLYKQEKSRITYDELLQLKIELKDLNYKIGNNFKLTQNLFSSDYNIELVDNKKDGLGRWKSEYVDGKKVSLALDEFKLTKEFYKNNGEPKLNEELGRHLSKYFENVQTQKGNNKGIFDIEIGNGDFVIEIKMASTIKSSKHGASGQINQYLRNFDPKKFMLLIAGEKNEEEKPHIQSLINECKKDFKCHWDYLYAK
ncbi:MAG: hypothetical protein HYU68_15260 [Bacteroidetes bacterium]|nr:hypothetical protein [Bacteroidota bacterium]